MAASSSTAADSLRPRKRLSPLYVFGVTTLAVFLAGVIGHRTPVNGYVATGTAVCKPASEAELQACEQSIAERLRGDDVIREAIQTALDGSRNPASELPPHLISGVRSAIKTHVTRGEASTLQVAIRYTDARPNWAAAIVNGLLNPLQTPPRSAPSISDKSRRQAWWNVLEARHYERKARFDLDNFFDEHFIRDESPGRGNSATAGSDSTAATPSESPSGVNPSQAAIELLSRLKELRERRARLQGEFTPQHPRVREVEVEIEKTEAELAVLDVTEGGVNTSEASSAEHFTSTTSSAPATPASPGWEGLLAKYRVVRQAYRDAVESCKRAEQASAALTSAAAPVAGPTWNVEPARITGRIGGRPQRVHLAGLGAAALAVGFVTSLLLGRAAAPVVALSVRQVEAALSLPIVGQLATRDGPPLRRPGRLSGLLGMFVLRASELVVALVFLAVLYCALSGSSFLRELVDDPLTTLSLLRDRVASPS